MIELNKIQYITLCDALLFSLKQLNRKILLEEIAIDVSTIDFKNDLEYLHKELLKNKDRKIITIGIKDN